MQRACQLLAKRRCAGASNPDRRQQLMGLSTGKADNHLIPMTASEQPSWLQAIFLFNYEAMDTFGQKPPCTQS
jgi:hypothetical protein